MDSSTLVLYPRPRRVALTGETTLLPGLWRWVIAEPAWVLTLGPAARVLKQRAQRRGIAVELRAGVDWSPTRPVVVVARDPAAGLPPDAYRVNLTPERVAITAATAQGAYYGLETLWQIVEQSAPKLPLGLIEDAPDFARRGVMIDISRAKVPTLATLFRLVDWLASLKINELQLYTEHTFAYTEHERVWRGASPLTGDDILALDQYCRERFVDLVPNQNSFAHFARWLRHEPYRAMAENPDGWEWRGRGRVAPFTLAPDDERVLPFLGRLYDELLPHFTSPYFNVGGDEPFDLGLGRSAEAVRREGLHRVYLRFLQGLHREVTRRGRLMQFWADIVSQAPALLGDVPDDAIALLWGYEANHPFEPQTAALAEARLTYYVCPGASNWNSILGRTENAVGNLREAARAGLAHGAKGYLITTWGDRGHQDPWLASVTGIAVGAGYAWHTAADPTPVVRTYLNRLVFHDVGEELADNLWDGGQVYTAFHLRRPNGTVYADLLHEPVDVTDSVDGTLPEEWEAAAAQLDQLRARLDHVYIPDPEGRAWVEEWQAGLQLARALNRVGQLKHRLRTGGTVDAAEWAEAADLWDAVVAAYPDHWLRRNRPGGLWESLEPLRRIQAGCHRLAGHPDFALL
jgi:hexosaminidase